MSRLASVGTLSSSVVGSERSLLQLPLRLGYCTRTTRRSPLVFDDELLDAVAEAAGDADLGLVPDAHLDAALDVLDLDVAARIQWAGFVDRRGGPRRRCSEAGE